MDDAGPGRSTELSIGAAPTTRMTWLRRVWSHREVLWALARKDFQVRYKRASFGIAWAVAVPLLQAAVIAVVFSRVVRVETEVPYAPYVFSGIIAWSYFNATLSQSVTSIVDGSGLTDKVYFPRALLVLVPCLANIVGFAVSLAALVALAVPLGARLTPHLALLLPATVLLVLFTAALSLVAAALHVYFRDVRFIVSAALLVWLYVTPVLYPVSALGGVGAWLDVNPMTGIISLFHTAILGPSGPLLRPVLVSVTFTLVLVVAAVESHRVHDRLFVDLL